MSTLYELEIHFWDSPREVSQTRSRATAYKRFRRAMKRPFLYYVTLIELDEASETIISTTRHVPLRNRRNEDE